MGRRIPELQLFGDRLRLDGVEVTTAKGFVAAAGAARALAAPARVAAARRGTAPPRRLHEVTFDGRFVDDIASLGIGLGKRDSTIQSAIMWSDLQSCTVDLEDWVLEWEPLPKRQLHDIQALWERLDASRELVPSSTLNFRRVLTPSYASSALDYAARRLDLVELALAAGSSAACVPGSSGEGRALMEHALENADQLTDWLSREGMADASAVARSRITRLRHTIASASHVERRPLTWQGAEVRIGQTSMVSGHLRAPLPGRAALVERYDRFLSAFVPRVDVDHPAILVTLEGARRVGTSTAGTALLQRARRRHPAVRAVLRVSGDRLDDAMREAISALGVTGPIGPDQPGWRQHLREHSPWLLLIDGIDPADAALEPWLSDLEGGAVIATTSRVPSSGSRGVKPSWLLTAQQAHHRLVVPELDERATHEVLGSETVIGQTLTSEFLSLVRRSDHAATPPAATTELRLKDCLDCLDRVAEQHSGGPWLRAASKAARETAGAQLTRSARRTDLDDLVEHTLRAAWRALGAELARFIPEGSPVFDGLPGPARAFAASAEPPDDGAQPAALAALADQAGSTEWQTATAGLKVLTEAEGRRVGALARLAEVDVPRGVLAQLGGDAEAPFRDALPVSLRPFCDAGATTLPPLLRRWVLATMGHHERRDLNAAAAALDAAWDACPPAEQPLLVQHASGVCTTQLALLNSTRTTHEPTRSLARRCLAASTGLQPGDPAERGLRWLSLTIEVPPDMDAMLWIAEYDLNARGMLDVDIARVLAQTLQDPSLADTYQLHSLVYALELLRRAEAEPEVLDGVRDQVGRVAARRGFDPASTFDPFARVCDELVQDELTIDQLDAQRLDFETYASPSSPSSLCADAGCLGIAVELTQTELDQTPARDGIEEHARTLMRALRVTAASGRSADVSTHADRLRAIVDQLDERPALRARAQTHLLARRLWERDLRADDASWGVASDLRALHDGVSAWQPDLAVARRPIAAAWQDLVVARAQAELARGAQDAARAQAAFDAALQAAASIAEHRPDSLHAITARRLALWSQAWGHNHGALLPIADRDGLPVGHPERGWWHLANGDLFLRALRDDPDADTASITARAAAAEEHWAAAADAFAGVPDVMSAIGRRRGVLRRGVG